MKKLKLPGQFRSFQFGFAGLEFILLVTIVIGIGTATKLALENQNLQKLAATPSQYSGNKKTPDNPDYYFNPPEKKPDYPTEKPKRKPRDREDLPVNFVNPTPSPIASPTVSPTPKYWLMPCSTDSDEPRCIADEEPNTIVFGGSCRTDLDQEPGDTPDNAFCANPNSIADLSGNPICICLTPTPGVSGTVPAVSPSVSSVGQTPLETDQLTNEDPAEIVINGSVVISEFETINLPDLLDHVIIDLHEPENPNPIQSVKVLNSEIVGGSADFGFKGLTEGNSYIVKAAGYKNKTELNYPDKPDLMVLKSVDETGNATVCQLTCDFVAGDNYSLEVEFNFPVSETAKLTGQSANNAIMKTLSDWFSGLINRISLINFFRDLPDAPGLKKGTCNPSDGGCKAVF